jgi:Acetoacetate decarboxylase (ADC)
LTWRDPWPSLQPDWHDPPWKMSGRALTAWFDLSWDVFSTLLSPDLLPAQAPTVRSRLRFYDLYYAPLERRAGRALEPTEGRFREAAIGLPARAGEVAGEVSVFLWTDSEDYLIWGREAFGWPVRLAELDFTGDVWDDDPGTGATGTSEVRDAWGSARVSNLTIGDAVATGPPKGCWLTPRRLLPDAGASGESRELLAVRPVVHEQGATYAGEGDVEFDFEPPHPLAAVAGLHAEVELAVGFEILVGSDTSVIPAPQDARV